MERCVHCGAETSLFYNGRPICVACMSLIDAGEKPNRKGLQREDGTPRSKALNG